MQPQQRRTCSPEEVDARIRAGRDYRDRIQAICDLVQGELDAIHSDFRTQAIRDLANWVRTLDPPRPVPPPAATTPRPRASSPQSATLSSSDVGEASDLVEEICDLVDAILADDPCEEGFQFAESVRATSLDIGETIAKQNRASSRQITALKNMLRGLERWRKE